MRTTQCDRTFSQARLRARRRRHNSSPHEVWVERDRAGHVVACVVIASVLCVVVWGGLLLSLIY